MKRSCVWVATLTAATLATIAEARAFTAESPRPGQVAAGSESHSPSPALAKPAPSQSGGYNFSGNSFNLSVTKNGRAQPEAPKVAAPPSTDPGSDRPGFFRRMLDWMLGD